MPYLIYNGEYLDSDAQYEITDIAMTVDYQFVTDDTIHTRRGVTEVHWRYVNGTKGTRVAIESDGFGTGETLPIEDLRMFKIRNRDFNDNMIALVDALVTR